MIKQKIQPLSSTPVELSYTGLIDPHAVLSIQNIMSSGYAYLGNENVSSENYGHKLYPGQSFSIEMAPSDQLFAVGDSGVSVAIFTLDM
jgi:hypothetical protein